MFKEAFHDVKGTCASGYILYKIYLYMLLTAIWIIQVLRVILINKTYNNQF